MTKKEIIVDNLKIVYFESKNSGGTPLIFLHGWKASAMSFANILSKLDNYIALDLPGFGGSQKPGSIWGVGEYANFLKDFLRKLDVKNPVLIGHSFGGSVIIKYLASDAKANKVILIDSAGVRVKGAKVKFYLVIAKIAKVILAIPGLNLLRDRIRQKVYRAINSEDYIEAGEMGDVYQKIIREDLSEEMKKIDDEVVMIWGGDDKATPLVNAEQMRCFMKNSKLEVIPGAGHWCFLDKEEEFMKILVKYL